MRRMYLTACACALLVSSARADIVLVSGTVTGFGSNDPALSGQQPTTFSAVGTFTPLFFSSRRGVLFGDTDWTITLNTGTVLSNGTIPPLRGTGFSSGLEEIVAPDGSSTAYFLFDHRSNGATTPPTAIYTANLTVFTGPPFDIGTGDTTSAATVLDDFRAAAAAGIRSGTFTFESDIGTATALFITTLTGSVSSLQVIPQAVPEPGTLAGAVLGGVLALAWVRRRCR